MYRILVTNDDGVYASGLRAAARSVEGLGEIIIVAPSGQESGVGRSVSVFEPLRFAQVNLNGLKAFSVTGTPTDSIIIGIFAIMKNQMQLAWAAFLLLRRIYQTYNIQVLPGFDLSVRRRIFEP